MSEIIKFYECKPTSCRHNLVGIWNYSYHQLEQGHDYIQWIFPLDVPSIYHPRAPILTKEDVEIFKNSPVLKWRVLTSVHTFMKFLHATIDTWILGNNHNHLRITRMLKCLVTIGLKSEAVARLNELKLIFDSYQNVNQEPSVFLSDAFCFWYDAVYKDNS